MTPRPARCCGTSRPAPASTRRPSSYTVDGKQYIVVGAGGNTQLDYKRGNNIVASMLPSKELNGRGSSSSEPRLSSGLEAIQ